MRVGAVCWGVRGCASAACRGVAEERKNTPFEPPVEVLLYPCSWCLRGIRGLATRNLYRNSIGTWKCERCVIPTVTETAVVA
jgi:hypothetical protein